MAVQSNAASWRGGGAWNYTRNATFSAVMSAISALTSPTPTPNSHRLTVPPTYSTIPDAQIRTKQCTQP